MPYGKLHPLSETETFPQSAALNTIQSTISLSNFGRLFIICIRTIAKSLSQGCNVGEALICETESNAYEKN